jgi:hypothetical protein
LGEIKSRSFISMHACSLSLVFMRMRARMMTDRVTTSVLLLLLLLLYAVL